MAGLAHKTNYIFTYFVSVERRTGFVFLKCFLIFNRLASIRYKTNVAKTTKTLADTVRKETQTKSREKGNASPEGECNFYSEPIKYKR